MMKEDKLNRYMRQMDNIDAEYQKKIDRIKADWSKQLSIYYDLIDQEKEKRGLKA